MPEKTNLDMKLFYPGLEYDYPQRTNHQITKIYRNFPSPTPY